MGSLFRGKYRHCHFLIRILNHGLSLIQVFRKVEKQLPQLTTLDLQYVSPELLKARNLDLAVPGEPSNIARMLLTLIS